jgi:hypothetical protein
MQVELITRITINEKLTLPEIIELSQGLQKGQSPVVEADNGAGATSPGNHSGKNGLIILQAH